jgi:shikimate kinase
MELSLIGMSGVGKSHWSKKMEALGYRRYSCDELIAERLGTELGKKGKATLNLAKWMGQPYSKGYQETEALYLKLENAVTAQICDELEHGIQKDKPVVVDTTGSLVYLEKALLKRLRKLTGTVHLNLPVDKHKEHFETYLKDPKPVIWNGKYLPSKGEIPQMALSRCYRELLSFRNKHYALMSDFQLDYTFHHSPVTTVEDLLELVGASLKQ